MEIKEFYKQINSDYKDVEKRFGSLETAEYFVKKFKNDKTYSMLTEAYAENDNEKAFRAAHTLKGVAQNLGFKKLQRAASEITEALRGGQELEDASLLEEVKKEHKSVISAISGLDA